MKTKKEFIDDLIQKGCSCRIFISNGFQFKAVITGQTDDVLFVKTSDGNTEMIYQHSITTIAI